MLESDEASYSISGSFAPRRRAADAGIRFAVSFVDSITIVISLTSGNPVRDIQTERAANSNDAALRIGRYALDSGDRRDDGFLVIRV
ncbi:MAG: hypothetical protein LBI87_09785 [Candidatus Accumulibacter sp.]|jgi:hypothetical protein|nr:hypothetical protein [Accumulibacter sp.]